MSNFGPFDSGYRFNSSRSASLATRRRLFEELLPLALVALSVSGCEAIGTIFKAGAWVGALAVIAVIAVVAFAVSSFRKS